jgi:broad specificity phosphatase PhoE
MADHHPRGPEIILVRHGRSSHHHTGLWLNSEGVRRFEDAYNAAGIRDDSTPSPELIAVTARAEVLAASDMLRAIVSARRLDPAREPHVVAALREITLDVPAWIRVPLPILLWDLFSHALWTWRLWRSLDHEHIRRADEAIAWLVRQAGGEGGRGAQRVVAVTHGGVRRLLDARLVARGWKRTHARTSYENWSVWSYSR